MHWVDRGPAPNGLNHVRIIYTPRWVDYYRHSTGPRPNDTRWLEFKPNLKEVFFGLCAYCECVCRGEVDHFQPKSIFPERVYDWTNWLLACHDCNQAKLYKWPSGGYVDPCATLTSEYPENFFEFDTLTGEIVPKAGLSSTNRNTAQVMIDDLKLNEHHHLKKRNDWLSLADLAISNAVDNKYPDVQHIFDWLTSRITQHSSIARAWLSERGYSPAG